MKRNNKSFALVTVLLLSLALLLGACSPAAVSPSAEPTAEATATPEATPEATAEATVEPAAEPIVLKVGASPVPHSEILAIAAQELAAQGITLDIVEYTDYVQPNLALDAGDLDANYFQHLPYLESFNESNGTKVSSAVAVHFEPLGLYPGKTASIEELKEGASIVVPNDTTNEARALHLLAAQGLITLPENSDLTITPKDIVENPKKLKFVEVEAAQVARSAQDVDLAVINGNYALEAGFTAEDALASETTDSLAAETYANILAVRTGDETRPEIQALITALTSDAVRDYINAQYTGAVIPVF